MDGLAKRCFRGKKFPDTDAGACKADVQASFGELRNLEGLERRLPAKSHARSQVNGWRRRGETKRRGCQGYFARRCQHVYFVKDVPVVSYVTVDCRPRDVTSGDVESDAKTLDTEADRLGHLLLKDLLQVCQSASEEGYIWAYSRPPLKGCRPSRRR